MSDGVVSASFPPVVLRMPEPVCVATSEGRLFVAASGERQCPETSRCTSAAASLSVGGNRRREDDDGEQESRQPKHQSAKLNGRRYGKCKRYARYTGTHFPRQADRVATVRHAGWSHHVLS